MIECQHSTTPQEKKRKHRIISSIHWPSTSTFDGHFRVLTLLSICYLFHFKWNNNNANKHTITKSISRIFRLNWYQSMAQISPQLWRNHKLIAPHLIKSLFTEQNAWPHKRSNNLHVPIGEGKKTFFFKVTVSELKHYFQFMDVVEIEWFLLTIVLIESIVQVESSGLSINPS